MAIHEFEPQAESDVPNITLFKNELETGGCIYSFDINGEQSGVTIKRAELLADATEVNYRFNFYDWEFGEADVSHFEGVSSVEWLGVVDGLKDLADIQARRLLRENGLLLLYAVQGDFSGFVRTDETVSNL